MLLAVIGMFFGLMISMIEHMIQAKNTIRGFLGYLVAIVIATIVLWIVLYYGFNINFLNFVPLRGFFIIKIEL